jgi:hypothetical protein
MVGGSSAPKSSGVAVGDGRVKAGKVGVDVGVGVRVWTLLDGEVGVRDGWMMMIGGVGDGRMMMKPVVGVGSWRTGAGGREARRGSARSARAGTQSLRFKVRPPKPAVPLA